MQTAVENDFLHMAATWKVRDAIVERVAQQCLLRSFPDQAASQD